MAISDKRKKDWLALMDDPAFQAEVLKEIDEQKADPLRFSALPYWLSLDGWHEEEGLLVLVSITPGTVVQSATWEEPGWKNGLPFSKHESFLMDPHLRFEPWDTASELDQVWLELAEDKGAVLDAAARQFDSLKHRLARTIKPLGDPIKDNLYSPPAFIRWAETIGFRPAWLDWAVANGHWGGDCHDLGQAPYFDADAPDYPELLHIAVRAWEAARQRPKGTPKQRILSYLGERHPNLPQGTREAIAQVANWQRTGGRPSTTE